MKREDLLDFNFDWRDDDTFKDALKESGLSEKEKLRLRDERMRRLELEELKEESGDYDDDYEGYWLYLDYVNGEDDSEGVDWYAVEDTDFYTILDTYLMD